MENLAKHVFTATKSRPAVFEDGEHIVKITNIEVVESSLHDKQIKVIFENEDGLEICSWMSFKGYKKNKAGEYLDSKGKVIKGLLDEDGQFVPEKAALRVEDEENTKIALQRFTDLACDSGIDEGTEFKLSDLIDNEVGIVVGSRKASTGKTYKEVKYTLSPEKVTEDSLF